MSYTYVYNASLLSRVKAIQEKVKSMRKAVVADFKSMFRESKDITSTSRWTKVCILLFLNTAITKPLNNLGLARDEMQREPLGQKL
jgi:hypothetical protein